MLRGLLCWWRLWKQDNIRLYIGCWFFSLVSLVTWGHSTGSGLQGAWTRVPGNPDLQEGFQMVPLPYLAKLLPGFQHCHLVLLEIWKAKQRRGMYVYQELFHFKKTMGQNGYLRLKLQADVSRTWMACSSIASAESFLADMSKSKVETAFSIIREACSTCAGIFCPGVIFW